MKYIRLKWNHTNPDEPVYIFSELDDTGKEIRKIECFRNGFCDIAAVNVRSGTAALTTLPLPDLSVLTRDPEFRGVEISPDEFEQVWSTRKYSAPES
jgi:uncharacterized protein with ParB-like and HNH nuclease domain